MPHQRKSPYVGYFLNEYGEELVFAQRLGENTARLWHSDADWQVFRVGDRSIRVDSPLEGVIAVEDLIIHRAEATWLSSCLSASRHLRPGQS
ncbi:hypothetical protein E1293_28465 [Actinomadura darangshiensis]|uniref:Uncharacterized protein n=1 Tax=Actinomadura darangshiensis TaxID=705336 RepID=A0A4R5AQM2_9ACTN|nr:hypothetical protein E1293_28465 [Actinomadura darangshiensis]